MSEPGWTMPASRPRALAKGSPGAAHHHPETKLAPSVRASMAAMRSVTAPALLLSLALVLGPAPTLADAEPGGAPRRSATLKSKKGKLSTVHLIRASRIDKDEKKGIPGGLALMFVIVRGPSSSGLFTLTELRDFKLDGASYAATTFKKTGRKFEPETAIENPEKVGVRGLSPDGGAVMQTALFGVPLPSRGKARFTLKVGWGKETEPFEFSLDLASLKESRGDR